MDLKVGQEYLLEGAFVEVDELLPDDKVRVITRFDNYLEVERCQLHPITRE